MNNLIIGTHNALTEKSHYLRIPLRTPLKIENCYVKVNFFWMYYTWRNITNTIGNNEVIILKNGMHGEDRIEILDGSYSVKDINDTIINNYKYETGNDLPGPILSENSIYNRIVLNIPNGYHIEFRYPLAYMIGLIDNTKPFDNNDIYKFTPPYTDIVKILDYTPKIENVNSVKIRCNLVDNTYQYEDKVLHTFIPNNRFGDLIYMEPKSDWRKAVNSTLDYLELWLTDEKGVPLNIEDEMEFTITIAPESFISSQIVVK